MPKCKPIRPTPCDPSCDPSACPVGPALPEQGGFMPVLWSPVTPTNLHLTDDTVASRYTLNLITTQWIDAGVLLRFQMYDGLHQTYSYAVANSGVAQFELMLLKDIPPATIVVVRITPQSTSMFGYTGTEVYAQNGSGVPAAYYNVGMSCLCFAYAPTPSGGWTPANGRPMFAIGFSAPSDVPPSEVPSCCTYAAAFGPYGIALPSATAPNFPDQWSGSVPSSWTFLYEVVFPILMNNPASADECQCAVVPGIKADAFDPFYPSGSWSNLRDILAQPWTIIKDNSYSTSRWGPYWTEGYLPVGTDISLPDSGPYILAAMPGQLVPVYFRPRYKNIDTDSSPVVTADPPQRPVYQDSGSAEIAFLVTSPLQWPQVIYFTTDSYNFFGNGGFGPRKTQSGSAQFVYNDPSFVWHIGNRVIPAGTVVLFKNIGASGDLLSSQITVQNAHDSGFDVGAVTDVKINTSPEGTAVVSIMALSVWVNVGIGTAKPFSASNFVAAALSDQYAGDFPPLSPKMTISRTRFTGTVVYGRGKIFDNAGLPGTVQAPIINSAEYTQIADGDTVLPTELPVFLNMDKFYW